MNSNNPVPKDSKKAFDESLLNSWQHIIDPEADNFQHISNIIRTSDFFKRIFPQSAELGQFADLAKHHFIYEIQECGKILSKDKEIAQQFSVLLKGNVQKLQKRPQSEVDHEISMNQVLHHTKSVKDLNLLSKPPMHSLSIELTMNSQFKHRSTWVTSNEDSTKSTVLPSGELVGGPVLNSKISNDCWDSPIMRKNSGRPETVTSIFDLDSRKTPTLGDKDSSPKQQTSPSITFVRSQTKILTCPIKILPMDSKKNEERQERRRTKSTHQSTLNSPKTMKDLKQCEQAELEDFEEREEEEMEDLTGSSYEMMKSHPAFMRFLAAKNPDFKARILKKNVCLLSHYKTFSTGDYIGENCCREEPAREGCVTVVSSEKVHLLTITREAYKSVLEAMARIGKERLLFFKNIFGRFDDELIEELANYFGQKVFQKGEVIYREGDTSTEFFIVKSGEIKLSKESSSASSAGLSPLANFNKSRKRISFPVAYIITNQFFGEEFLRRNQTRQYTATVSLTDTSVYYLDLRSYRHTREMFKGFFDSIKEQAQERSEWRQERVQQLSKHHKTNSAVFFNHQTPVAPVALPGTLHIPLGDFEEAPGLFRRASLEKISPYAKKRLETEGEKGGFQLEETIEIDKSQTLEKSLQTYKRKFGRTISPKPAKRAEIITVEKDLRQSHLPHLETFNVRKELGMTIPIPRKTSLSKSISSHDPSPRPKIKSISITSSNVMHTEANVDNTGGILQLQKVKSKPDLNSAHKLAKFSYIQTHCLAAESKSCSPKKGKSRSLKIEAPEIYHGFSRDKIKLRKITELMSSQTSCAKLGKLIKKGTISPFPQAWPCNSGAQSGQTSLKGSTIYNFGF